jgi:hypothetical protein
MAWRAAAPAAFRTPRPSTPQQSRFIEMNAPIGSRERDVLLEYVSGGESLWFNNFLRGIHMEELSADEKSELKRKTTILNKLIYSAPVSKHKLVLFRAISQDAPKFRFYKTSDDADYVNKGMISTSISYGAAKKFLEKDETCCMIVILIPKGAHMLEVLDNSVWNEEKEVLLPHGSRFKVVTARQVEGIETFFCALISQTRA